MSARAARAVLRGAAAAALLAAASLAAGQGASVIIGGLQAMHAEDQIKARYELCSVRFPAAAEAWRASFTGFRGRNAGALDELLQIRTATRAAGRGDSSGANGAQALQGMQAMAAMLPHVTLASLDDSRALPQCERWRDELAEGGAGERALPGLLAAARRLQPRAATASEPAR